MTSPVCKALDSASISALQAYAESFRGSIGYFGNFLVGETIWQNFLQISSF